MTLYQGGKNMNTKSINDLINNTGLNPEQNEETNPEQDERGKEPFLPIIDFSNFLLIVLKLTQSLEGMEKSKNGFIPDDKERIHVILDDKELIHEFDKVEIDAHFVKKFGYHLLFSKYLLDNYIVHRSSEYDTYGTNPWKLQCWQNDGTRKNLANDDDTQRKLVHLLSMFEVSYGARQRKNYLFYCLLHLFSNGRDDKKYLDFLSNLADTYFKNVYLNPDSPNEINTPKSDSFDDIILVDNKLNVNPYARSSADFVNIYGDGTEKSKRIPLFVFNYLDYKLWEKYADDLQWGHKRRR